MVKINKISDREYRYLKRTITKEIKQNYINENIMKKLEFELKYYKQYSYNSYSNYNNLYNKYYNIKNEYDNFKNDCNNIIKTDIYY